MKEKTFDVFGIGNPVMDVLIKVEDDFLKELGLEKGAMKLVDETELKKYEEIIEKKFHFDDRIMIPGGSVANTVAGVINLGGKSGFCGKVGDDMHAKVYRDKLEEHGVESSIATTKGRTAVAITLITPDSERTFIVHLGVANQLHHGEVLEKDVARAKYLHLSGYVIDAPETRKSAIQAMEYAKRNNTKVSLDFSDYNLAKKNKEIIKNLMKNYISIIFANEEEAEAYTGKQPEEAVAELGKEVETAIVKIGSEGSIIMHKGRLKKIEGFKANAIDTTGAGDMYAAGVLFGLADEWPIDKAGMFGSYAAAKIVEKIGARLETSLKDEIVKL